MNIITTQTQKNIVNSNAILNLTTKSNTTEKNDVILFSNDQENIKTTLNNISESFDDMLVIKMNALSIIDDYDFLFELAGAIKNSLSKQSQFLISNLNNPLTNNSETITLEYLRTIEVACQIEAKKGAILIFENTDRFYKTKSSNGMDMLSLISKNSNLLTLIFCTHHKLTKDMINWKNSISYFDCQNDSFSKLEKIINDNYNNENNFYQHLMQNYNLDFIKKTPQLSDVF